ncbi:MAG TPA: DinB family protein [Verrucomicrobiae bacterium]|jgi:DinB superfamily|nr:DinB family protein [Verrucomicrobiae bacterium]
MDSDKQLRQQLAKALDWHEAHADLAAAVADFPVEQRGDVPDKLPHSAWQLLEHIRIALWDVVEFCQNARHKSPPWPEGYWPKKPAPPSEEAWDRSVEAIHENIETMRKLITDPKHDLLAPIPGGSGQTLLREALLIADHNAYHLGQLVLVRRALGKWKG